MKSLLSNRIPWPEEIKEFEKTMTSKEIEGTKNIKFYDSYIDYLRNIEFKRIIDKKIKNFGSDKEKIKKWFKLIER